MGKNVTTSNYSKYGFLRRGKGKDAHADCQFCPATLTNTAVSRMEAHQRVCKKTGRGSSVYSRSRDLDSSSDEEEPSSKVRKTSEVATPSTSHKKSAKEEKRMSQKEGQKTQENLADLILGNRLPFRIVDDYYFRKFVCELRPGVEKFLPCRQTFAGTHVDAAVKRYRNSVVTCKDEDFCILVDSWKNKVTKDKWLCFILHNTAGRSIYLKSDLVTELSENADLLTEKVRI